MLRGFDETNNGTYPAAQSLLKLPKLKSIVFCPQHFSVGTPRELRYIHGGTDHHVLMGQPVCSPNQKTTGLKVMIHGAGQMLKVVLENKVLLAILLDISAACGLQVISIGQRTSGKSSYHIKYRGGNCITYSK
jgi:uncharacterized protein YbbK (DUF523 family)